MTSPKWYNIEKKGRWAKWVISLLIWLYFICWLVPRLHIESVENALQG